MEEKMYGREFMYGPDTNLERERFIKECSERHIRAGHMLLAMLFAKLARIGKLPQLNYKPRKTTYKTVKRFSAKRNRI